MAVIGYNTYYSSSLIAGKFLVLSYIGNKPNGLTELLKAPFIHGIPLDEMIPKNICSPDSELCTSFGIYSVTNGYDGIKVEVFYPALYASSAFSLNCCEKCNS